jgi:hypothetical protein
MQQTQSAWALVGCLNAIAIAILVIAVSGVTLSFWRIVGGAVILIALFALMLWRLMRGKS